MLRRPATVLTITAEDIAAYEDRQERAAFRAATAAAAHQQGYPQHQQMHLQQHQQFVDAGGFTSSGDEFVSDDEAMVDAFDAQQQQMQMQMQAQAAATGALRGGQQPIQQQQGMQTPMQAQLQTPTPMGQDYGAAPSGIGAPARNNGGGGMAEPQVPQAPQRQRAGRGAQPMPQQGQGQMAPGAAVTPEGRVTRSRDERIGLGRGAARR